MVEGGEPGDETVLLLGRIVRGCARLEYEIARLRAAVTALAPEDVPVPPDHSMRASLDLLDVIAAHPAVAPGRHRPHRLMPFRDRIDDAVRVTWPLWNARNLVVHGIWTADPSDRRRLHVTRYRQAVPAIERDRTVRDLDELDTRLATHRDVLAALNTDLGRSD